MDRSFLIDPHGDATNAVLAAIGYNIARLIPWLRRLLCALWLMALKTNLGPMRWRPNAA